MTTHKAIREALIAQADRQENLSCNAAVAHESAQMMRKAASLLADLDAKTEALERIASITNQMFGGDWDEIEDAREIARAALKGTP